MLEVGDTIGDYEIAAKLKSGGMATLFLGRSAGAAGFARHVAIKVVHSHLAENAQFVDMFVDEAHLSARIQHPNVVHVEQLGEDSGRYYLVMEYVHGCALGQLIRSLSKRRRRMCPELATYVAMQVAEGLQAAHETRGKDGELLGVVHRDVSPQNVLLAYQGHVKLIDFGIAKARGRSQDTATGSVKGKFAYMSPEQAQGLAVDRRTDIYALGILLWEMVTGRRLFKSDNELRLLNMVRDPSVPAPSTKAPVPTALEKVIMRALAPRAEDRYATAQDFRRALALAVPGVGVVDSTSLSGLLRVVMQDQIAEDEAGLPRSVTALVAGDLSPDDALHSDALPLVAPPPDEGAVLQTMTLSAEEVLALEPDLARQGGVPRRSPGLALGLAVAVLVALATGAYFLGAGGSSGEVGAGAARPGPAEPPAPPSLPEPAQPSPDPEAVDVALEAGEQVAPADAHRPSAEAGSSRRRSRREAGDPPPAAPAPAEPTEPTPAVASPAPEAPPERASARSSRMRRSGEPLIVEDVF